MKPIALLLVALLLSACGAEVASTAATVGAARSQEAEQAQQTRDAIDRKLDAATAALQKNADDTAHETR